MKKKLGKYTCSIQNKPNCMCTPVMIESPDGEWFHESYVKALQSIVLALTEERKESRVLLLKCLHEYGWAEIDDFLKGYTNLKRINHEVCRT